MQRQLIALVVASSIALAVVMSVVWIGVEPDLGVSLMVLAACLVPALAAAIGVAMRQRAGAALSLVLGLLWMPLAILTFLGYGFVAFTCDYAESTGRVYCQPWFLPLLGAAILLPALTMVVSWRVLKQATAPQPDADPRMIPRP